MMAVASRSDRARRDRRRPACHRRKSWIAKLKARRRSVPLGPDRVAAATPCGDAIAEEASAPCRPTTLVPSKPRSRRVGCTRHDSAPAPCRQRRRWRGWARGRHGPDSGRSNHSRPCARRGPWRWFQRSLRVPSSSGVAGNEARELQSTAHAHLHTGAMAGQLLGHAPERHHAKP